MPEITEPHFLGRVCDSRMKEYSPDRCDRCQSLRLRLHPGIVRRTMLVGEGTGGMITLWVWCKLFWQCRIFNRVNCCKGLNCRVFEVVEKGWGWSLGLGTTTTTTMNFIIVTQTINPPHHSFSNDTCQFFSLYSLFLDRIIMTGVWHLELGVDHHQILALTYTGIMKRSKAIRQTTLKLWEPLYLRKKPPYLRGWASWHSV